MLQSENVSGTSYRLPRDGLTREMKYSRWPRKALNERSGGMRIVTVDDIDDNTLLEFQRSFLLLALLS